MSRRERERVRHRQEILDAACQEFSEKGFRNTTIADISKRSEFSIASIYKHFESKEDLYHSLIEDTLQMAHTKMEEAVKGIESPLAQIRAGLDAILNLFLDNRAFLEFFVGEFRISPNLAEDPLAAKSMDAYRLFIEFFALRFEQAVAQEEVARFDPIDLAVGMMGHIFIFSNYWIFFGQKPLKDVDRTVIPRLFFERIALTD